MAITKLQAKCRDLKQRFILRAEQQIRAAYPHLHESRKVTFSAHDSFGKQQHWENCFGCYCVTLRIGENNELLYHDHAECWYPLHWCKNICNLVDCADHLLYIANGTEKSINLNPYSYDN